ncbi:MAG TPA: PEP/pyruvate-binding domain-containing protein [Labilithrix sp.]|nr:PEP/pyruvate-binding domain-containing protein [Labilithrix sp.]
MVGQSSFLVALRRLGALFFTLLLLGGAASGCSSDADVGTSDEALTFQPTVLGDVGGVVRPLSSQEALDLRFVSYGKVLTWEGLVEDFGKPTAQVHLIDTKRFDGHFGYTKTALGRDQLTENQFFTEVSFPASRRYMPFLAFDLRAHPIQVGAKSFKWVMNIRRYNWRDDEVGLANFAVTLRTLLSERLMKGFGEPLLFVYDMPGFIPGTTSLRRPHVTQLGELTARGFEPITEGALISAAGASLVSVLNPGVAFGYLKLVPAGDQTERLTPRHIAVFQDTPERVPPVSGIVTLEPQTPLSHLNLLAKNRGTPNVSTAQLSLIPGLEGLFGKMVKMEAEAGGAIHFREASLEEANAFFASRQQTALEVPEIQPVSLAPVEFATGDAASIALPNIGSKAANYATIQKLLGLELVKPGFALGFAHYLQLIAGSPAAALITDLVANRNALTPEEVDARLVAIRTAIQEQTPAAALAVSTMAIRQIASRLPGIARIRFRSSTNSEDLPVFNGAGLYESAGFDVDDSDAKLGKKLLQVMSSLWLERAYWERELFGIDHAKVAMAILVNPAFSEEYANGVVVGAPEGEQFASWINAQKGEASVTNPLDGEVPESFRVVGPTTTITTVDSRSNIADVFLAPGSSTVAPSLASQLGKLHAVTKQLHTSFVAERQAAGDQQKYAIDIEYKLMSEAGQLKLYVKQSRLLALRSPEAPPVEDGGPCSVQPDAKLRCPNAPNTPMRAQPSSQSAVVNTLRTTTSWFTCWTTGELHAGGNKTWYWTQGDDNANWGFVPASALSTTEAFDASPSAKGLPKCSH